MWQADVKNSTTPSIDIVEKQQNHIYFYASVTSESIHKLNKFIREANNELSKIESEYGGSEHKIFLHINSFGGQIFAVLGCLSYIQNSKYPITTIIEGACASAATLISLMGTERQITSSSFMLIHQLSSGFWGKMSEIDDEYENLQQITDIIKKHYQTRCSLSKRGKYSLENLLKHDLWLPAEKCLQLGLVTQII